MDPRLYRAVTKGDIASLTSLLDESPSCLDTVTVEKNTALHIAAGLGYAWSVTEISNLQPSLISAANSRGDTPVHCAARAGHEFVLAYLISRAKFHDGGHNLYEMRNGCGNTPLHEAARNGHLGAASELVKVEKHLTETVNDLGESAVYLAAERGAVEIVRMLLQFVGSELGGPNGQNALHAAVCRSYEITEMLLENRSHLTRAADDSQSTPLHYAASLGDYKMVQLLLHHDAAAAYLFDKDGLSPIHVAARMGYVDTIERIVEACPDAVELIDKKGQNLLHVAADSKALSVVKYVIRKPAFKELLNDQDHVGNTPLHLATIGHNLEIIQLLLEDKRVDAALRNHKGLTPLDLASSCTDSSIQLRMHKIMAGLASAGSRHSPQRMDLRLNKFHRSREEEINRCRAMANNLAIVGVLIATVTFAAAFTLPGGYNNDDNSSEQGVAILAKEAAFKAFLISDAIAMVSSIAVTCLLIFTGSLDHDIRLHSISTAMKFMCVALGGMVVAFAMGTYVVVVSKCPWLAILICVVACTVPFLTWMLACWPAFDSLKFAQLAGRRQPKDGKSGRFKVVGFQMPHSMVVDFETPIGSRGNSSSLV
ncbi:ankyrin repeat-containing protein-like [Iris pallida]|uniref:Ankyrin repeat-containing protein-like n=1 Tax=Iris pallida TaxID=29817 RepID=A0AAX6E0Y9_IRIPA|nr:ankyrin repeat-containing protein-like [Iris pallida]